MSIINIIVQVFSHTSTPQKISPCTEKSKAESCCTAEKPNLWGVGRPEPSQKICYCNARHIVVYS